ncbi:zinc-binding alcohol dehydrogenase [Paenibacillus sp. SYP-B3998]|nr:zinc-binding alcohol dehydrogenase [Paenibacillus sp. SYP-B3998]
MSPAMVSKSLNFVFVDKEKMALKEEEVPALGPDDILCRAIVSLISAGTELACLRGVFEPGTSWESWVKYPFYPGYSMTAEVLQVGERVKGIQPGERIICQARHMQFFVMNVNEVTKLPEGISDDEGAFMQVAKITLVALRRAEHQLGEYVGVIGAGLLGQFVIQYAKLIGARKVIAIAPSDARLQLAKENGATDLLSMEVSEALPYIQTLTAGRLLDTVYDVTGGYEVLSYATQLSKELGKVILLGDCTEPSKQSIGPTVVFNSVSILGIHGRMMANFKGWTEQDMSEVIFEYMMRKEINVQKLITHRFSPKEAVSVYDSLRENRLNAMGIMFDWKDL